MIRPAELTLRGGRWEPFILSIAFPGLVFPGGITLGMQLRLYKDAPGAPLVSLIQAPPPAEGITYTVSNGDTFINVRINETTMEALPYGSELGGDVELAYDIQVTWPGNHDKARYFRGSFIIEAGVTH